MPSSGDLSNPGIKLSLPHLRQILYHLSHHNSISFFVPPISFRAQAKVIVEGELPNRNPIKNNIS